MPAWPQSGFAKDCGGFVLVKLGAPAMQHYTLGGEEFLAKNAAGMVETQQGWQISDDPKAFGAVASKVFPVRDGEQYSLCLLGEGDVYALRALRRDRYDAQYYTHNGTGLIGEGLQVPAVDLRALGVQPGSYRAVLWVQGGGSSRVYDLEHRVTVK
jgi:hypothetical protein